MIVCDLPFKRMPSLKGLFYQSPRYCSGYQVEMVEVKVKVFRAAMVVSAADFRAKIMDNS